MTRKRRRRLQAKPGELIGYYGYTSDGDGPDLCVAYGGAGAVSADGNCLLEALSARVYGDLPFWRELETRGYDLDTLKFSVRRKKPQDRPTEGGGSDATA